MTHLKAPPRTFARACERCHRYKERCTFKDSKIICERCDSLGKQCHPRQKERMGRRPAVPQLPYGATSILRLNQDENPDKSHHDGLGSTRTADIPIYASSSRPESLYSSSGQIIHVLETAEGFFEVHRDFIIGPSFMAEFQSAVRQLFTRSPQVLSDAYSVALKLMASRSSRTVSPDVDDLALGARCLQKLMDRSSSIAHADDAAVILLLGQALLVHNTLIPSPATHVITRGILLSVKDWLPAMIDRPYLDSITLTPVLMDAIECLIRREMPAVRLPSLHRCIVDRFLGLRSSLVSLLYELCERSYESKTRRDLHHTDPSGSGEDDSYVEVERKIQAWIPEMPPKFFARYSTPEIVIMLAQARTYRLAALLVIRRLRFPLGVEDLIAQDYADAILRELSVFKTWPPDAATGFGLDFPLLVASLELPGLGSSLYKVFEPLRFRRQHSAEILRFINLVTAAREAGYQGLWFDLVHDQLHGLIMT